MSASGRNYLACLLLAVAACAAYWNSLNVPFLFDDHASIDENPTIKHLAALGEVLRPPKIGSGVTGRPVVNLSLALNYAVDGTAPRGYHVLNLIVHLGAGLALFGVVRRTLLLPRLNDRYGAIALPFAWAVAAIWILHPLQTESVTCVIQRTELLLGLFYLLTFYCFVRSVEDEQSRVWPVLAVASCLLGMASKEVMVSAPLMVLLYDRTFITGSFRGAWERRRGIYVGLAGTWLLLGLLVAQFGGTRGSVAGLGLGVSPFAYALKQCEAIVHYLRLGLWPHPLNVDYGEDLSVHPVGVWVCAAFLVVLVTLTAWSVWRRDAGGFLGAWFFVILAPSSSVVPLLTQTIAEHRMYLPLAAVVVAIVSAMESILSSRRALIAISASLALLAITALRNHDYRSVIAIWQDTVAKSPLNSRAHHNLGVALAQAGRSPEAIECFRRSLVCKPTDAAAHYSLAHELAARPDGRAEAIAHYEAALRILPGHLNARINLAFELSKSPEHMPEAIEQLETVLRLYPDSAMAHNNLATILKDIPEKLPEALVHAEQAVQLDPNNAEFHFNLANALKKIPERIPDALAHYEQALRLRPNFFHAHYAFANLLAPLPGRAPEAIAHYSAAAALQPEHPVVHYNLGVMLANTGRTADAIREFETVLKLNPAAADAREALKLLGVVRN